MRLDTKIRIRIAVVIIRENKILLVQHHKKGRKYWLFPGGGLEYGETINDCAIRELKEEANLNITIGDLLLVSESIPPDRHRHVVNLYYKAEIVSGEIKLGNDKVISDIRFIDIHELEHLDFFPNVKHELMQILKDPKSHIPRSIGNRWE
jgi:8-oxo-dGTP diphosphatase